MRARTTAVILLALPVAAQEPAPRAPASAAAERPAWPELDPAQRERAAQLEHVLRAAAKHEPDEAAQAERREAEDGLAALGPAVAPFLLIRISDRADNINDSIAAVLDRVTAAEHAPLLAEHARDRVVAARRYVLRRLTELHVPAMAPVFRRAREDRDADVVFQAGLGLASIGDLSAMDEIFARCEAGWNDVQTRVEPALRGARGEEATACVLRKMEGASDLAVVAGLRLLRSVGGRDTATRIKPYLDAEDGSVRKAAINALRVLVDGAPPIEDLSVFQAIEMAKQWKGRV